MLIIFRKYLRKLECRSGYFITRDNYSANISFIILNLTDSDRTVAKSNADVIILAQDSRYISAATLKKVKNIAKDLVRRLDQSNGITFRYMWGTYASSSRVSGFVSKNAVTSKIDSYKPGTRGQANYLKGALNRVKNKLSGIKGNPAKVIDCLQQFLCNTWGGFIANLFYLEWHVLANAFH